jgi:hypothetical protein
MAPSEAHASESDFCGGTCTFFAGTQTFFLRFQDRQLRQVVGANLQLASESLLLVQARRIALGDRTPVVRRHERFALTPEVGFD